MIPPTAIPAAVVEHFWKTYSSKIPKQAIVLASTNEFDRKAVRTALDKPLDLGSVPTRAFLFFVDLEPEANWAHACGYAFVSKGKEVAWCDAEWPPHASIALKLQARP